MNSSQSAPTSIPVSSFNNSINGATSSANISNFGNSMDYIFDIFDFSLTNIIEYSISLMLFLEPIHVQLINEKISPINFSFNILDRNQMASSTKYVHKTALNNILTYYNIRKQEIDVIEIWVDTQTGVNYVFHRNGNAAGFTALLDKEGKPVVT